MPHFTHMGHEFQDQTLAGATACQKVTPKSLTLESDARYASQSSIHVQKMKSRSCKKSRFANRYSRKYHSLRTPTGKSAVLSTNFEVEEALLTSIPIVRVVFRGAAWGQWGGAPFDLTSPQQGGF